jgi:V/A-type H+-transporting ATPase subunit I
MTQPVRSPLRPRPARWFELLVARDDTTLALEALAATGAVELESRGASLLPQSFADLAPLLPQFAQLAQRYRAYWPRDGLTPSPVPVTPVQAMQRSIDGLQAWAHDAEPRIRRLQAIAAERDQLRHWRALWAQAGDALPQPRALASAGPSVQVRLAVLPAGSETVAADDAAAPLLRHVDGGEFVYLLALGTPAQMLGWAERVHAAQGRLLEPPSTLPAGTAFDDAQCERRLAELADEEAAARDALAAAAVSHRLREALADTARLQWVLDNVHGLETGALFCWITGWTSAAPAELEATVERSGARALLRLPPPPPDKRAPMLLANPWWARPFEVFARAMGMPSGTEADPSALLAIAVPLMFGYMFGDVGQGLVIAAAGFALRRRWPMARLFVAGGLSAAFFGLLFGSVFSLHVLHPWWIAPLDDPLAVLLVPLAGGAALLALGLLLSALQAHWRGELARWLGTDAGFVLCYLGLLGAFAGSGALVLAGAGALLFCLGHAWHAQRAAAALGALGELVERMLQILINTLSFARVGAFALAHAGLSSAIVALMQAAEHPLAQGAVLVIGNVVVIALEGLVVSIQTTRLVLFEFFARFLEGQGRVFRPLPLPPSAPDSTLQQET